MGLTGLLRGRYAAALLVGDDREASRVVRDALDRGVERAAICLEVLGPALGEVGEAWARGEMSIAGEHLATSITLEQMAYVREAGRRKDDVGATVVVAAVEGEMHSVGTRMIADLFHIDGWDVAHLGQDTPAADLVELVRDRRADLVVLSVSHPERLPAATEAASMLKALGDAPAVFVGGRGISPAGERGAIEADLVISDPLQAIRVAREILGLGRERLTLEVQLRSLGRRVQELRRELGWSQQELASRSDLDRTYLSRVEQGRQNITIAAAMRIADALGTSLTALIDPSQLPEP